MCIYIYRERERHIISIGARRYSHMCVPTLHGNSAGAIHAFTLGVIAST